MTLRARRVSAVFACAMCALVCVVGVGPKFGAPRGFHPKSQAHAEYIPDPDNFRCIVVGDSQTTSPDADRIRTQFHQWDVRFVGEQLVVGNGSAGYLISNSSAGIPGLGYELRDVSMGWGDGGPNDFYAIRGHEWTTYNDINAIGSRMGRFRLRFNPTITAPWNEPWGIGADLRARILVRTSPDTVPAIEVRSERGNVVSSTARGVYELNNVWGIQIIDHPIPADFNPMGDDVGIGLYFPSGYEEQKGQRLQILGVMIERVGLPNGSGSLIAYQGRGGWSMHDHLSSLTQTSRLSLIEATDADHVMIILGHNQEPGGIGSVEPNLDLLVAQWEAAYKALGRSRPHFIYVCPWAIVTPSASEYMLEVERVMRAKAAAQRMDLFINYLPLHDYTRPDIFDPARYSLDGPQVHPGDVDSAVNLSHDLYEMLFEGRRD